ncbi:MAG: HEPN domain-containing protein [Dehalococcoidia bacterium]|nr:HEPN domain-containing protein [Dehalococcoidia bacterium]
MSFRQQTTEALKKLGRLVMSGKGTITAGQPPVPVQLIAVPDDIPNENRIGYIGLDADGYAAYHHGLAQLRDEPELEYLSNDELDAHLGHLTSEMFLGSSLLKDDKRLNSLLKSFENRILKPLENYEVIIPILDLKLGGLPIEIAGIKLYDMTVEDAAAMGIEEGKPSCHPWFEALVGHTTALVSSRGNDPEKVVERARGKLRTALNLLRLALVDHTTRIILWKIHDSQLMFKDGEYYLIRKEQDVSPSDTHMGWQLGSYRTNILTVDDKIYKQAEELNRFTQGLFVTQVIQGDIREHLVRAIEWIGSSIRRETNDDKMVDLCVALETLLATKQDGRKGELIALRSMLLCLHLKKPWFDPGFLLYLYDKRSGIVHGSRRGICTASDNSKGMMIAIEVFRDSLTHVEDNQITKHSKFIASLQDKQNLATAVGWLKQADGYQYSAICEAAEDLSNATYISQGCAS